MSKEKKGRASEKKKERFKNIIVIAILIIAILLCLLYIADVLLDYMKGDRVYTSIREYVSTVEDDSDNGVVSRNPNKYRGVSISLAQKINKDIISWIYIPDTRIDYPIVRGIDNEKYLDTLVDGSEGMSGTLFIDSRIEDYSRNLIIYGHNMKDGSMFHNLRYYEDSEWRNNHNKIYLSFEDYEPIEYNVVGVCEVESNDVIYDYVRENDSRAYDWIEGLSDSKNVDRSKRIVALSTCKGTGNIRILVLIQEH